MIRNRTTAATAILAASLALLAAGCGSARAHRVPNVVRERLDVAEETLDAAGLRYRTIGGGVFGIVIRSDWVVCRETPRPGSVTTSVTLVVDRDCCPSDPNDD